ncbi:MAG: alpha-glucan family phosphorylase [Planctomycetota bacterium]
MTTTLFEASWEVCNKVGGIHTVVSSKAKTLVAQYGDQYITLGPWLLASHSAQGLPFEDLPGYEDFAEACRRKGVPVRVGRWQVPGRPITVLVEFSGFYAQKDGILAGLWERFQVDSLLGTWDYIEPLLFGHACGLVIEEFCERYVAPQRGRAVAQFHEWMTGAGILYLKERCPNVGTVFTTHATMLGRVLSATGLSPEAGLGGRDPRALAEAHGVRAKHSLEGVCGREADVFTTVSDITAREAEVLHGRKPSPVLPNGIDLDGLDEICGPATPPDARRALDHLATAMLGAVDPDAAHICISGRYEFHNKGIDVYLGALSQLNQSAGRPIVAWVLVPAGNSGVSAALRARLVGDVHAEEKREPLPGYSTHNLFDADNDPVQRCARELGLVNGIRQRVRVIQVPIYLEPTDGVLNLPYEAALRGFELSCFPSFYEPWGYTPMESIAVGVPTVTSDLAGFGHWIQAAGLGPNDGVHVLQRTRLTEAQTVRELAQIIEERIANHIDNAAVSERCRQTAAHTSWPVLIEHYEAAFEAATRCTERRGRGTLTKRQQIPVPVRPTLQGRRPQLFQFDVAATLPEKLAGLARLADNYWWSWDPEACSLFEELSQRRWNACQHNPVRFLREVYPEDLRAKAEDSRFVYKLASVLARFDSYLAGSNSKTAAEHGLSSTRPVAYFCAEFGVHESLKTYAGGLGLLAGDHLKSASDLALPLVGVGLFYRKGYLSQQLAPNCEQLARPDENDPNALPMELVCGPNNEPMEIALQFPSSVVTLTVWRVKVGRVALYLLDSESPKNRAEDCAITHQLYAGDVEHRLKQEIVLSRGGIRLLERLGLDPLVYHMNEGHSALLALERVSSYVREQGLTFDEAREMVRASTLFTTHTPVPAGHDRFGEDLLRRYFSDAGSWVGLPWERFFALGETEEDRGQFNMTYLAIHFAGFLNGVSRRHGEVTRGLLKTCWPQLLSGDLPVRSITNGVHLPTWVAPRVAALFGAKDRPVNAQDFVRRAATLPSADLWRVRTESKRELLAMARQRLADGFVARRDSPAAMEECLRGLDEQAFFIGFARRFAPYKRAQLLFRDLARLTALVNHPTRPVRILIAGKAHPRDGQGQQILRSVAEECRRPGLLGRVIFLEDYNIDLARQLVRGVDLWLNNPVPPLEASGTSGMKAAANGALNLSVADGWWEEAYDGKNGWVIARDSSFPDQNLQDELDAGTLYSLLEEEILPLYFTRNADGIPEGWLARVRQNFESIPPQFNTDRMVGEYSSAAYCPLARQHARLAAERYEPLRQLTAEHARLRKGFEGLQILSARVSELNHVSVGDTLEARVEVALGTLTPADISVELVVGHSKYAGAALDKPMIIPLAAADRLSSGSTIYDGCVRLERCGRFSYGIRARVRRNGPLDESLLNLVLWA